MYIYKGDWENGGLQNITGFKDIDIIIIILVISLIARN